jgi:putative phosphoesterase
MKIVIISDIHGNYDTLKALPESYDELWVLGDLVNYGPEPYEAVDFIRSAAKFVVRGNHDHAVAFKEDPRCAPRFHDMAIATQKVSEEQLTDGQKTFLQELPYNLQFQRDNKRFYLCHAEPSDPLYAYRSADSDTWAKEIEDIAADVLLVGHTHKPFIRRIGVGRTSVAACGCGRVGKPLNRAFAGRD